MDQTKVCHVQTKIKAPVFMAFLNYKYILKKSIINAKIHRRFMRTWPWASFDIIILVAEPFTTAPCNCGGELSDLDRQQIKSSNLQD